MQRQVNIKYQEQYDKAKTLFESTTKAIRQIAILVGVDKSTVSKWSRNFEWGVRPLEQINTLPDAEKQFNVLHEREKRNLHEREKGLQQEKEALLKYVKEVEDRLDIALALQKETRVIIPKIGSTNSKTNAVPLIQWSDWHVEERVERGTTRGLNEFNPDICRQRVIKLAENTVKLIKKEKQDVNINDAVINLGGDFINNYLHEHDVQMNYMAPIEALGFAKELLKTAILTVLKNSGVKKLIILCIRGNHPRLTKRMQSSNDYKMNLEAIMYNMLKQELNQPEIEWVVPDSEIGMVTVYGYNVRAFHGHQIGYQGGIGGLTIPMNKYIMRHNQIEYADLNMVSHWHQYSSPTKGVNVNGSLVGYNSYALSLGFAYEKPLQTFQLLDETRGLTVKTPIFCE